MNGMQTLTSYIDTARLMSEFAGDEEILAEMCDAFLVEIPNNISGIGAAIGDKDLKNLEFTAHTLKGAIANFQAPLIKDLCYKLEQLGRANELAGCDAHFTNLKSMMDDFTLELIALIAKLKKGKV
jgi:HPt (histidine-containing phosphotransfer) domain-containing protein